MSRQSTLLWLALVLGATAEPARSEIALAAPVEQVRNQLRGGNVDAAIEAGELAVEALANDSQAWFWLGRAYAQQAMRASLLGKPRWAGKTHDAYLQAVTLDPANLDARFDLMQYYVMAPGFLGGDREKADAQAREVAERDVIMGKLATAMLAQTDKKADVAEAAYRDAVKLDPSHERARISLAMFLQRDERWDEIRGLWDESLLRNPDDALAHYQLGRMAAVSGKDLEAGLGHLDRFLALGETPEGMTVGAAYWRRGQVLEKLGRRDDAIAAYADAVGREPFLTSAKDDLERLQDD
jgi:tetratricopeptide (TPR) repeat protein